MLKKIHNAQKNNGKTNYDNEKYRELILEAAEAEMVSFEALNTYKSLLDRI